MDPAQSLADLTEISSQIRGALILDAQGVPVASTFSDERSEALARSAAAFLRAADEMPREAGRAALTQAEAATPAGSVFVVRDGDRAIAAVTERDPTAGLVFYDLKTALRLAFEDEAKKTTEKKSGGGE